LIDKGYKCRRKERGNERYTREDGKVSTVAAAIAINR
jgi:hypothetical protein